jgi:hypothetical protein
VQARKAVNEILPSSRAFRERAREAHKNHPPDASLAEVLPDADVTSPLIVACANCGDSSSARVEHRPVRLHHPVNIGCADTDQ